MPTENCPACKFWSWFEEEQQYKCSIKGCWEGSKFVEYNWRINNEDVR